MTEGIVSARNPVKRKAKRKVLGKHWKNYLLIFCTRTNGFVGRVLHDVRLCDTLLSLVPDLTLSNECDLLDRFEPVVVLIFT